ncbi:hypothetical protein IKL64_00595 [bacterium]|nr:hypothetical protein [bacterium]
MDTKKKCDLICSLGGNCAAAHNLRYRNMRNFALPFDWCFIQTTKALERLCDGFQNGFKDFCLKENLVQVESNKAHSIIFKDSYSEYFFPNHFSSTDLNQEYDIFYKKFKRRVKRLISQIEESENILFLFSSILNIEKDYFLRLEKVLKNLYPEKNFEFRVMLFKQNEDKEEIMGNIHYIYYLRDFNLYDYTKTNFEWAFLDSINLNKKRKRTKMSFSLFNHKIEIKWKRK